MRAGKREEGFTLLAVLAAMAFVALALQSVMTVVSQQAQREREARLIRIGNTIVDAIGSYYRSSPGSVKNWPQSLDDLTSDTRFVDTRRYLREVYADPLTRSEWGIIRSPDGGVTGVFSRSDAVPLRAVPQQRVGAGVAEPASSRYSDWKFVFTPELAKPEEH